MKCKGIIALAACLLLASCVSENPERSETSDTEASSVHAEAASVSGSDEAINNDTEEGDNKMTEKTEETEETKETEENRIPTALQNQKHTLRFDENGEFRIVVFGDVQAHAPSPCSQTIEGIKTIVDREQPDLVLFAGDNAVGFTEEEALRKYLSVMTEYIEEKKIPWAHVYGNHDDESGLSRERQQEVYESFEYCVSQAGPEDIKGVGNYVLPVYSSDESRTDPIFAVWGLDSGGYLTDEGLAGKQAKLGNTMFQGAPGSGYAYMPFTQIRWYFDTSEEIEEYAGHKVPALAYFHIPLQEFYEIWLNKEETGVVGVKSENVCAAPLNSGMFTAMVERGDVKAVCCGHDHINDYSGEFCGIKLCYSSNIGFDTYHDEDVMGGRVFVIKEAEPENVETYVSYLNGFSMKGIKKSSDVLLDFENSSRFTLVGGEDVKGAGDGGSTAVKVDGDCTIQNGEPFRVDTGRYLKLWLNTGEGTLKTIAVTDSLTDENEEAVYTFDTTEGKLYCLAEGETEWQTIEEGEQIPKGFVGRIAVPVKELRKDDGCPAKDTIITGFKLSSEGSVIVDSIQMVTKYKD